MTAKLAYILFLITVFELDTIYGQNICESPFEFHEINGEKRCLFEVPDSGDNISIDDRHKACLQHSARFAFVVDGNEASAAHDRGKYGLIRWKRDLNCTDDTNCTYINCWKSTEAAKKASTCLTLSGFVWGKSVCEKAININAVDVFRKSQRKGVGQEVSEASFITLNTTYITECFKACLAARCATFYHTSNASVVDNCAFAPTPLAVWNNEFERQPWWVTYGKAENHNVKVEMQGGTTEHPTIKITNGHFRESVSTGVPKKGTTPSHETRDKTTITTNGLKKETTTPNYATQSETTTSPSIPPTNSMNAPTEDKFKGTTTSSHETLDKTTITTIEKEITASNYATQSKTTSIPPTNSMNALTEDKLKGTTPSDETRDKITITTNTLEKGTTTTNYVTQSNATIPPTNSMNIIPTEHKKNTDHETSVGDEGSKEPSILKSKEPKRKIKKRRNVRG